MQAHGAVDNTAVTNNDHMGTANRSDCGVVCARGLLIHSRTQKRSRARNTNHTAETQTGEANCFRCDFGKGQAAELLSELWRPYIVPLSLLRGMRSASLD